MNINNSAESLVSPHMANSAFAESQGNSNSAAKASKLDEETIARFQPELARMGYKFQFVTSAGFHAPIGYSSR
jgi:isocitrate lyase